MARKELDWQGYKERILAGLNLKAEFAEMGIDLQGEPGDDGWAPCRAIDREDNSPSAAVNCKTGHYIDKGGQGLSLSFWDLVVHLKRFATWKDARDHYAAKAGATIDGKPPRDPAEHLAFLPWNSNLVALWCRHKPGVIPEAVQAAGGRLARYRDQYTVICLPIYGPGLLAAEPVGWVLWNFTGKELPIFQGRDKTTGQAKVTWKKMKTTGGSESGLLGRHAIEQLTQPGADPAKQIVWKVEGPSDMLALWAAIPDAKRANHLVLANAGGATEAPRGWMATLFAGRAIVAVGDLDNPGQAGAAKWAAWAAQQSDQSRVARLPGEITADHGQDLRDWLNTGHTYSELLELADDAEPIASDASPPDGNHEHQDASAGHIAEEDDDPHRLARINLERYATRHGGRTLRYWRDEWYVWKGNRYQKISERELRAKLTHSIRKEFERIAYEKATMQVSDGETPTVQKVSLGLVSNVLQATSGMVCLPSSMEPGTWIPDKKQKNLISMQNGILDIDAVLRGEDTTMQPNSPEWFSMVSLPYPFNPEAACPKFNAFLEFNLEMDPERIKILQEWAGYVLLPDTGEQKFMVLEGEGSNGKSVYIAALTAMIGKENVSNVPLEKFGDRFSLTTTLGKLLNAAGDCGDLDKAAEGDLKSFTGGDRMYFDRKGIQGIECAPTARLMIACNNRPRFADRTQGIWRRMLLIPWKVAIDKNRRIRGMHKLEWWQASDELPGVFNWALEGLARLRNQQGFTESSLMQDAIKDYQAEANPARAFLDEVGFKSGDDFIYCQRLYYHYSKWCEGNGHKHPLSERQFGKEVKRKCPTSKRERETTGSRQWFYSGVSYDNACLGEKI